MCGNTRFARGYLITDAAEELDIPPTLTSWDVEEITDHTVYIHPALSCNHYSREGKSLGLLGRVIDPINNITGTKTILRIIHESLSSSREEFYDYLDHLTGRFVLFVKNNDEVFVLQDATGNQSLFYEVKSNRCLLASHSGIIAEIGDHEVDLATQDIIDSKASYFPGVSTPHPHVKMLTPNTQLNIPSLDRTRFFPREPIPDCDLTDDLLEKIANILKNTVDLLNKENKLSLSLSAGIDSRLSLAATNEISEDVRYWTWAGGDPGSSELSDVISLCEILDIDLDVVWLDDSPSVEFMRDFRDSNSGMSLFNRGHTAFNLCKTDLKDTICIRSNVAEIGRTYYRDIFGGLPDDINSTVLSKLYGWSSHSEYVVDSFEEFIEIADFTEPHIYNYDPYDLFYWEHRMGCWLSLFLLELGVALDEFILYNNRKLLKLMLSVDRSYRRSDDLFYNIIDILWKDCLEMPINPHTDPNIPKWWELKRYISGAVFRLPQPLYTKVRDAKRT